MMGRFNVFKSKVLGETGVQCTSSCTPMSHLSRLISTSFVPIFTLLMAFLPFGSYVA